MSLQNSLKLSIIINKINNYVLLKQLNEFSKCHINDRLRNIKCWKCGVEKNTECELFCNSCNIIQKPCTYENYFKIIGFNQTFDIDLKLLTQKYRKMQTLLHPDKYSNKTDEEKQISEEYSSIINEAYKTLQSPMKRGLHLLNLNGETISENEEKTDQSFLLEIMELNEQVEEADTPGKLLNLNQQNRKILHDLSKQVLECFNSNDIVGAKRLLIRMKYYTSIATQIHNILREKNIVE